MERAEAGGAGSPRRLLLGSLLTGAGLAAMAQAALAFSADPFFDEPVAVVQALALERVGTRTRALAAFPEPPDEVMEQGEKLRSRDLPLFIASLRTADLETASALTEAVDSLLAVDAAAPLPQRAEEVMAVLPRAREALLPGDLRDRPDFQAAVVAKLLLADDGVAESYEDAAKGERWEYPAGWAALQRVREIWKALPDVPADAASEIEEMLAYLGELLPNPEPPEHFAGDPEAPEAYAHRLVGFLEVATDADLYPGRDLARAAAMVAGVADQGCEALRSGDPERAAEQVAIARLYFRETLRRPLSVMAPKAHEAAMAQFEVLLPYADREVVAQACAPLLEALEEGQAALTPSAAR